MQGTGGGYKKFLNRQADIWNASRVIDPKEVKELAEKGIEWLELNIAIDGIVIAVNPKNTWCSNLTCEQLKQIWEPDSKVKTWSDLDPSWPAQPILLYGADSDSGTFEYFTEVINEKKKATNTNYTPAANDNVLVQGIAANKTALGYIPFGYFSENTEKLKALGVADKTKSGEAQKPFVEPTEEAILSGEYAPLARPLYMYVNKNSLKRPEVASFLRFAVSKESQSLIGKRGFVKGEGGLLLVGGLGLATGVGLLAVVPDWHAVVAIQLGMGLMFYMFHGVLQARATEVMPEARGTAVAAFALALFLGQTAGSLGFGTMLALANYRTAFAAIAVGVLVLALWTWSGTRRSPE